MAREKGKSPLYTRLRPVPPLRYYRIWPESYWARLIEAAEVGVAEGAIVEPRHEKWAGFTPRMNSATVALLCRYGSVKRRKNK